MLATIPFIFRSLGKEQYNLHLNFLYNRMMKASRTMQQKKKQKVQ